MAVGEKALSYNILTHINLYKAVTSPNFSS